MSVKKQMVLILVFFLTLIGILVAQRRQVEDFFVDDIKVQYGDLLRGALELEKEGRWAEAFGQYLYILGLVEKSPSLVAKRRKDLWIGVRRYVVSRIAKFPVEVFEEYRYENDSTLNTLVHKAKRDNQPAEIERLTNLYFFCSGTDEILDELANHYMEEGEVDRAIGIWERLIRYYPDLTVPKVSIIAKLALGYRYLNNTVGLRRVRERFSRENGLIQLGSDLIPIWKFLEELQIEPPVRKVGPRNLPKSELRLWSTDLFTEGLADPPSQSSSYKIKMQFQWGQPGKIYIPGPVNSPYSPGYVRLQDGKEFIICNDGFNVVSAELDTGRVRWRYPPLGPVKRRYGVLDRRTVRKIKHGRISYDIATCIYGCTVDYDRVYVNIYRARYRLPRPAQGGWGRRVNQRIFGPDTIAAFDIQSGIMLWSTDELSPQERKRFEFETGETVAFSAPPLVIGNRLYIPATSRSGGSFNVYVFCLDKYTGHLIWKSFICNKELRLGGGMFRRGAIIRIPLVPLLTYSGGIIYCLTNLGGISALDASTGDILWIRVYKTADPKQYGNITMLPCRIPSPPLIYRNVLFCLPQNSKYLYMLEPLTGNTLGERLVGFRRGIKWIDNGSLLGVFEGFPLRDKKVDAIVLVTKGDIVVFDATTLKEISRYDFYGTKKDGQPVLHQGAIYIPSSSGLRIIDLRGGKGRERDVYERDWEEWLEGGRLWILGNKIVSINPFRVTVFSDLAEVENLYKERLKRDPYDVDCLVKYIELLIKDKRLKEAREYFEKLSKATEDQEVIRPIKISFARAYIELADNASANGLLKEATEHLKDAKVFAITQELKQKVHRGLAKTYEGLALWEQAEKEYKRLLKLVSERSDVRKVLGHLIRVTERRDDIRGVIRYARKLRKYASSDEELAAGWFELIKILERHKEYKRLRRELKRLARKLGGKTVVIKGKAIDIDKWVRRKLRRLERMGEAEE